MHRILTSHGKSFDAAADESMLDAALRAGVTLEYSCRTGRCATCKARVRSGSTLALHEEPGLTAGELGRGWILTCVRAAASDVELDVEDLGDIEMMVPKVLPARVHSLDRLSADVLRVMLRLPPARKFNYRPGQSLDVIAGGGIRRSYSIANAPSDGGMLEFHVGRIAGGVMSHYWFDQARVNDLLRLNGPLGTFFLRDVTHLDLAFLATGTGIAPVKAMLEGLAQDGAMRPASIKILWGVRNHGDSYWTPDGRLGEQFTPVLSRPHSGWTGARGYVQHELLEQKPDLARTVVYACGSAAMINAARASLVRAGLPERRFHADAFVSSSES